VGATATFWLTVVAGLGLGALIGTLLSGLLSSSLAEKQREHERQLREADDERERKRSEEESKLAEAARQRSERGKAYAELLTATALVMHRARVLGSIGQVRSGTTETVSLTSNQPKPIEPVELDAFLRREYEPLLRSWSDVWLVGSQAAINQANRLLNVAVEVIGTGTGRGKPRRAQPSAGQGALRALGVARREFAEVARRELGSDFAESFLSEDEPKPAVKSHAPSQPEPDGPAVKADATTAVTLEAPSQPEPDGPAVEPEPTAAAESDGLSEPEPQGASVEPEATTSA